MNANKINASHVSRRLRRDYGIISVQSDNDYGYRVRRGALDSVVEVHAQSSALAVGMRRAQRLAEAINAEWDGYRANLSLAAVYIEKENQE